MPSSAALSSTGLMPGSLITNQYSNSIAHGNFSEKHMSLPEEFERRLSDLSDPPIIAGDRMVKYQQ